MPTIGSRIAERRSQLGLTQEDLAKGAGVTAGAISLYESDKRTPSLDTLARLARVLKVNTDYLLGDRPLGPEDVVADPEAAELFRSWGKVPEHVRQTIMDIFRNASTQRNGEKR